MPVTRRQFLTRLGIGAGGVCVLAHGGRALAGPSSDLHALLLADDGLPVTTDRANLSHFGRMFPKLPHYGRGFSQDAVLADLALLTSASTSAPSASATSPLVEPGGKDDTLFGAWFTYFGQMVFAHDMTLDPTPQPSAFVTVDKIPNYETMYIDMSSMYGGGPKISPQLYESDGVHFLTQLNSNGVADLPRNSDGSAIIVELRDDEQELTSQLLYAFEQFHNAVANAFPKWTFDQVAATVRQYIQWIVLNQWLPQIIGQATITGLQAGTIPRHYKPGASAKPMTPVEWSVAGQRLHPMVRNAYALELTTNGAPSFPNNRTTLFNGANGATGTGDLHGGRPLPAGNVIDWGNFVNELARGSFDPGNGTDSFLQAYKQIIPQLGGSAFLLPIGGLAGVAASGSQNLAYRDLVRSYFYRMATGQAVAAALGNPVISPTDVLSGLPTPVDPSTVPTLAAATPLWLYSLAETYMTQSAAGVTNGFSAYLQPNAAGTFQPDHLGPTGAAIIGDVVLRMLETDPAGILHPGRSFTPQPPIAPSAGSFGIADLLVFAGVATAP
jgi:Animal haem peroxidase